ncbi:MAG: hypothetical protein E7399_08885 [Ruminococcaceae bacterium]|nr:hypothetical protein [Oscillospiraceae bacterium]
MKKVFILLLIFTLLSSCLVHVSAAHTVYIYVSPNGDDANAGTYAKPVASLQRAITLSEGKNAVISMMGGTYNVAETATLGAAQNLTIRAYNDAEVILTAAQTIDVTCFKKVTDTAVLDRVVDKKAKDKIVSVNMAELGITELGEIPMSGFGYPAVPKAPQLLINGNMQTVARYPDDGYLNIDSVIDEGVAVGRVTDRKPFMEYQGQGIKIRTNDARLNKWKEAKNIFMFGYFMHDWAEAVLSCTIDFENKNTISTEYPSYYGVVPNQRFYFFNLLEEISKPGEWYLDRETGMLYLYPETELKADTVVEFITYAKPFITMDGAENVTIEGISFTKGLDMGIDINKSKNVTVTDCDFVSISSTVIDWDTCYDCTVSYCNFKEIGARGVYMNDTCGDLPTLTPGNNIVTNCVFDGIQRITPTSTPAIWVKGVGNVASHNVIRDGANIAIWFGGNNHVIEYNDISEVCKDTADAGAIYAGRNWACRGNEVRFNYIHDMKIIDTNTGMKVQAIYLDDGFSSANVHGNIIKDVPSVALFGGGRHNVFEENIIIGCDEPFVFDERYLTWDQASIRTNTNTVPFTSELWLETYPELKGLMDDEPGAPKYNVIRNNVSMDSPGYRLYETVKQYATEIEDDVIISKKDFVDYNSGNLNLKEDSDVFKKIPEFDAIDFDAIGVQEKPVKEKTSEDVLTSSVLLKLNVPKTFVFGNESTVDSNNANVYPFTENDRTLVPVRFIAEAFGGTVSWDATVRKVSIVDGDKTVELIIDDTKMNVNGKAVTLDVPAQVWNDRTMLPLRAVAEALGKTVYWDNRGLIILSDSSVVGEEDGALVDNLLTMF